MERAARQIVLDDYSDDESLSPTPGSSKHIRHDSAFDAAGTHQEPIDIDQLPDPVSSTAATPPAQETAAMHEPLVKRRKLNHRVLKYHAVYEVSERKDVTPQLNIKPLDELPAPIQKTVPENLVKTEDGLVDVRAHVSTLVNDMASEFKTAGGKQRIPERRKKRIEEALPNFHYFVSVLGAEDQMSCIEQLNSQVIYSHNKSERKKKFKVEPVPYPERAVETLRGSFMLVATPPEYAFQKAESILSWPVEFECRHPFIRKQQLVDVANGYREGGHAWPKKNLAEWKYIWTELCRKHNLDLDEKDEDYVNPDLPAMTDEQRAGADARREMPDSQTTEPDEEMPDADGQPASSEEAENASGGAMEVGMPIRQKPVDDDYSWPQSPDVPAAKISSADCEFCNNDGHNRPVCPGIFKACCECCQKPCGCGVLPNERLS